MTKHEFMARLASELHKRNVADAADVIEEYEQHFAFKLADGYSEEEIAAKLGSPEELAAQFESTNTAKKVGGSKALAVTGLCFADLFAGLFFVLLAGWLRPRDGGGRAARGRLRLLCGVFAAARPLLRPLPA